MRKSPTVFTNLDLVTKLMLHLIYSLLFFDVIFNSFIVIFSLLLDI